MCSHKRLLAAVAFIAMARLTSQAAQAQSPGYTFDLRVHGTGASDFTVSDPGDTVLLDLFVHVQGQDANPNNDGINDVFGLFKSSTGGLLGDLVGVPPPSPFNLVSSGPGRQNDLDGDGDLDIGSNNPMDPHPDFFYFARGGGDTIYGHDFLLGQVRFTAFSLTAASTSVNFKVRPVHSLGVLGTLDGAPFIAGD